MLKDGIFKSMMVNLKALLNFTMSNVENWPEEANTGTDIAMMKIAEGDMVLEVLKLPYQITELLN